MKGGMIALAITKKRKEELVASYGDWAQRSRAMIIVEYTGLSMKQLDDLRAKVREVGGEFHIVKNTLGKLAFQNAGLPLEDAFFAGSTAIGFAFTDAPALAKTITDFAKTMDVVKIKGGYLSNQKVSMEQVKALANLPPLPVMRAQLLGTILAPASKLVRTLAEPGRGLAAVIKAYYEPEAEPVAA